ncbi:MAG: DinB family protein [candidate division Zixibacteria bacterium]
MQIREHLTYMVKANKSAIKGFIGDITEDESMDRIDGRFNHIRWQTGHILYSNGWILSMFADGENDYKKLKSTFAGGSTISDNPDDYPTITQLKKQLDDTYEKILSALEKASDIDLEKEVGEEKRKEPFWKSITFLCMHDFYHMGQIMYNRTGVGKKWPFGG